MTASITVQQICQQSLHQLTSFKKYFYGSIVYWYLDTDKLLQCIASKQRLSVNYVSELCQCTVAAACHCEHTSAFDLSSGVWLVFFLCSSGWGIPSWAVGPQQWCSLEDMMDRSLIPCAHDALRAFWREPITAFMHFDAPPCVGNSIEFWQVWGAFWSWWV